MMDRLKEPALHVGEIDENINLSLPPVTGEEYIKRVVIEAQQCAEVVVADIDRTRLKKPTINVNPLSGCVEAPPWLGPSQDWQQCQVSDFSAVRLYVSQLKDEIQTLKRKWRPPETDLPSVDDENAWVEFCSGSAATDVPTLNRVFRLSQPTVERVMEYLVERVEREERIGNEAGRWIYALLAVLELPLTPDACSCLRSLARACSIVRANSRNLEAHDVGPSNLFICLVARYFRQWDLADP